MRIFRLLSAALLSVAFAGSVPVLAIAQGQDWFVPGQGRAPRPAQAGSPTRVAPPTRPAGPRAPSVAQPAEGNEADAGAGGPPEDQGPRGQVALPAPPKLVPVAKGVPPPVASIGVLGVPDVMRGSLAAQQVERVIGERRQKFQQDAQKEQASWRELQQSFAAQRASLTPDQLRARERELQERITRAQRQFRERDRIMQDAARFGLAQIEQTMVAVIRQVAESRGINIVLNRAQVALNINEFDLTEQVADQLNKVLPTVELPADGAPVPMIAEATPSAGQPSVGQPSVGQPLAGQPGPTAQAAPPPPPVIAPPPAPGPRATPAAKP